MTDVFPPTKRSQIMSSVRPYDTQPELLVRSMVHRMGYRFRIHKQGLPGNPDIVLPKHKKVIFVHGCFWHGHRECSRSKRPGTHQAFWGKKLDSNMARDKRQLRELRKIGWDVLVVWQCQLKNQTGLQNKIECFLKHSGGGCA
jgi:DNA mismatch endonuclease (patch repair protein)